MNARFFAAIERTPAAARVPTAASATLAEPAAAATALVLSPERATRFLAETLGVVPVAGTLPGAARRGLEVEPAARFVEAVAEGTAG